MNPARNAYELVRANKLATCKRCGESSLAWVKLASGKWALVATCYKRPVYAGQNQHPTAPDGFVYANKLNFHRCNESRTVRMLSALDASKADCYRALTTGGAAGLIATVNANPIKFAETIDKLESIFRHAGQQIHEWN